MADDMARHSISLAMQMTERTASLLATEVTAVTNLLEAVADYDNRAGKLLKYQKDGNLNYNLCDRSYSGDFEKRLKQEGILYYKAINSKDPQYDIYIYPDCYGKQVTDLIKDHMIQKGLVNVVEKDEMVRTYKGNGLMSVDGLTKDQLVILKELLRGKPITVALTQSEKAGKYKLLFHKDMEPVIQKSLLQQCIRTNSKQQSRVSEAVAFDVSYKRNLYEQAVQTRKEHYYILSENHAVLEVTPKGCAYQGEDGKYILDKKDLQYQEKVYADISRMQRPVPYSRADFHIFWKEPEEKKRKWYLKKVAMEKYPDYSKILLQEMKRLEEKTSLMEKKIAMDNPNRQVSEYDLFNDKMSFTAFEEEEFRNTEHEIELLSQKEVEEISEQLTEYRIKPETIQFSQYQILYETGRRQEHMPDLFREPQERNGMPDTRDMLEQEHTYEEH